MRVARGSQAALPLFELRNFRTPIWIIVRCSPYTLSTASQHTWLCAVLRGIMVEMQAQNREGSNLVSSTTCRLPSRLPLLYHYGPHSVTCRNLSSAPPTITATACLLSGSTSCDHLHRNAYRGASTYLSNLRTGDIWRFRSSITLASRYVSNQDCGLRHFCKPRIAPQRNRWTDLRVCTTNGQRQLFRTCCRDMNARA